MNMIRITKTWQQKTAADIIAAAEISRMQAGTYEITSPALPGYIIDMTDDDYLVVNDAPGACCRMELDADQIDQLRALCEAREAAYE